MTTLFGKTPLEQLRDLDYTTESHTFSKGVIAAYYNAMEYPTEVTKDYIMVHRRRDDVYFVLHPAMEVNTLLNDKVTVYQQHKMGSCKIKTKEVVYDLDKIFTNPSKQVRRAIKLGERISYGSSEVSNLEIEKLYNEWSEHKMNDGKTFRIAFTPKRYLRSFRLNEKGFKVIHIPYYIKGELYGIFAYEVSKDTAFELAFISRFWRKDLKIVNDLSECILIDSFQRLYNVGIKKVNVGPTGGIKGLRTFKNKLPHDELIIYSN